MNKVTYIDEVTVISAQNLNDIQDAINTNETDIDSLETALDAKAPLVSPEFTGNPTALTQLPSDNSNRLATTAYVTKAIKNLELGNVSKLTYTVVSTFEE